MGNATIRKMGNAILHKIQNLIDLGFLVANIFKSRSRAPPVENGSLVLKSATELAEMIRNKETTCYKVVIAFIDRIRKVNAVLNCVVKEKDDRGFDDALAKAKQYDNFLATTQPKVAWLKENKPFLGVPFTCKEAFMCHGRPNSSGMVANRNKIAEEDAPVVAAMKTAGGILLGVTTVPEMCMWWETSNMNNGTTNNPYDTRRMVGGSSGGEACAVSSAASPWGIGSDIGGSIRMPALFNGVFGHKPSPHQVSNKGQFPGHVNDDDILTTGPICSHFEDLIPMFKIMVGEEKAKKLRLDEKINLEKLKLKVYSVESISNALMVSPVCSELKEVQNRVKNELCKNQGAEIEEKSFKDLDEAFIIWSSTLALTGAPTNCDRLSTGLTERFNPRKELVKKLLPPLPFLEPSIHTLPAIVLGLLEELNTMSIKEKEEYAEKGELLRLEIIELLGENGVLLLPSGPKNWYYHHQAKFTPFNCSYTMIGNFLKLPVTQVPLGLDSKGFPLGIQVIAGPLNDRLSIAVAGALSKSFGGWVPPMKIVKAKS